MTSGSPSRVDKLSTSDSVNWRSSKRSVSRKTRISHSFPQPGKRGQSIAGSSIDGNRDDLPLALIHRSAEKEYCANFVFTQFQVRVISVFNHQWAPRAGSDTRALASTGVSGHRLSLPSSALAAVR